MLFTDTDSLCYEIQTNDFYKDIAEDVSKRFDTSNYPKGHPIQSDANKKVLGMMKDEAAGKIITEFVGLRSKLYAYEVDGNTDKKCKGVKKSGKRTQGKGASASGRRRGRRPKASSRNERKFFKRIVCDNSHNRNRIRRILFFISS